MHPRCSIPLVIFLLTGSTFATAAATDRDSPAECDTSEGEGCSLSIVLRHNWIEEEQSIEAAEPAEYGTTEGFTEETIASEGRERRDEEKLIEAAEPARSLCKHEIAIIAVALLLVLTMLAALCCCQLLTYGVTCGRHRFTLGAKRRSHADAPQVVFNRV